jgi:hypothetical protein
VLSDGVFLEMDRLIKLAGCLAQSIMLWRMDEPASEGRMALVATWIQSLSTHNKLLSQELLKTLCERQQVEPCIFWNQKKKYDWTPYARDTLMLTFEIDIVVELAHLKDSLHSYTLEISPRSLPEVSRRKERMKTSGLASCSNFPDQVGTLCSRELPCVNFSQLSGWR